MNPTVRWDGENGVLSNLNFRSDLNILIDTKLDF
jgi:hypothetical protein